VRGIAAEGSFAGFDGTAVYSELNGFFRDDLAQRGSCASGNNHSNGRQQRSVDGGVDWGALPARGGLTDRFRGALWAASYQLPHISGKPQAGQAGWFEIAGGWSRTGELRSPGRLTIGRRLPHIAASCNRTLDRHVGQTIAVCGLSRLLKPGKPDRRQKPIVCPIGRSAAM
jgi:hypothetical protein